jgi:hypothetical protein
VCCMSVCCVSVVFLCVVNRKSIFNAFKLYPIEHHC